MSPPTGEFFDLSGVPSACHWNTPIVKAFQVAARSPGSGCP